MKSPIGFIGLGIMGKGMLKNLILKHETSTFYVWNRSPEAVNEMKAQYEGKIFPAENPMDVIHHCDLTFCMLSTLEASKVCYMLL